MYYIFFNITKINRRLLLRFYFRARLRNHHYIENLRHQRSGKTFTTRYNWIIWFAAKDRKSPSLKYAVVQILFLSDVRIARCFQSRNRHWKCEQIKWNTIHNSRVYFYIRFTLMNDIKFFFLFLVLCGKSVHNFFVFLFFVFLQKSCNIFFNKKLNHTTSLIYAHNCTVYS